MESSEAGVQTVRKSIGDGFGKDIAVRSLAFKWVRILYRCWQDRKFYDEAKYPMALEDKGSPLVAELAK